MKKLILASALALSTVTLLSGCVVARTSGQAVVADAPADNHLRIVIVPPQWEPAEKRTIARIEADRHVATLFPALATRLPQDFKLNGLEAESTLLESFDSALPAPTATTRTLVVRPAQAGFIGYTGGTWLDLAVTLNDAKLGTLWKGTIRLSTGTPGLAYDASAVDHAAVPLLEQLRDAKLIDISWRRPTTP